MCAAQKTYQDKDNFIDRPVKKVLHKALRDNEITPDKNILIDIPVYNSEDMARSALVRYHKRPKTEKTSLNPNKRKKSADEQATEMLRKYAPRM